MPEKRSFTIVSVSNKKGSKSSANAGGRFESSTPASAARKAASRVCRKSKIRGQCTLFVSVKETTQGSAGKVFNYKVKRVVVNEKVNHNGVMVNHKYATFAKKDNSKTL
jgi:hypothetical protein